LSTMQKNVLTFYREYLKFANTKQDVIVILTFLAA
jgi:hypothetical protein